MAPGLYLRTIIQLNQSVRCSSVIRSNLIPIDHMPERGNLAGTMILVIQTVRRLPNVQPEDGRIRRTTLTFEFMLGDRSGARGEK